MVKSAVKWDNSEETKGFTTWEDGPDGPADPDDENDGSGKIANASNSEGDGSEQAVEEIH